MKKLSVLTVSYNSAKTISKTLESVRGSISYIDEYIVIDGGSNDGTVDILKVNNDIITDWISEPDKGISNAFNKGIQKCSGDYILILNSDDLMLPHKIEEVKNKLVDTQIIYLPKHSVEFKDNTQVYTSNEKNLNKYCSVFHPGAIIPKNIYMHMGGYDERKRVSMDYEFFCRCFVADIDFVHLQSELVLFRVGGESSNVNLANLQEVFLTRRKYFGSIFPLYEARRYVFHFVGRGLHFLGLGRYAIMIKYKLLKILYQG